MKIISRTLQLLAVAGLAATLLSSEAVADPTVSVVPTNQTINVADPVSFDIIVSGLTEPVGGFSFLLYFNDIIVSGDSYVNDPGGTMGAFPLDLSFGFTGGSGSPLDIFYVADDTETQASLAAAQGASFTLTKVTLMGLANGLSPLTLTLADLVLSNWDGSADLEGVQVQNGSICVGGNCNEVPEPATLLLLGAALSALAIIRRRRRAA